MPNTNPLGIGIAGCGNISGPYAKSILNHPDTLKIVGACDLDPERTKRRRVGRAHHPRKGVRPQHRGWKRRRVGRAHHRYCLTHIVLLMEEPSRA